MSALEPLEAAVLCDLLDASPQRGHFFFAERHQVPSDRDVLIEVFVRFDAGYQSADRQRHGVGPALLWSQSGVGDKLRITAKTLHADDADGGKMIFPIATISVLNLAQIKFRVWIEIIFSKSFKDFSFNGQAFFRQLDFHI